jgi:HPt (histidine-containing phosphotransfer) domain-containing protein
LTTAAAGIRARLADLSGDEPCAEERALLARMLGAYPAKTAGAVRHLAEALRSGDAATVEARAHGLKGSAANLGATALAGLFGELEGHARDGDLPGPEPALAAVHRELDLITPVCAVIAAELTATGP